MAEQKKQDTNQLLKVRREKLADLQANGKDPFQITKFDQTHHSLEVKNLYEAHEAEILKDHKTPDVEGLDEAQAREVLKQDYEERRKIMDANPIHVAIAGRMMFKRVMGKKIGCPDLLILFTNTVSHKMVNTAIQEAKRNNIPVARIHSSSASALHSVLEEHCVAM